MVTAATPLRAASRDGALRGIAGSLVVVTAFAGVVQGLLLLASGVPWNSREAVLDQAFPVITTACLIGAVVGALIVDRRPGHRIGWLFCLGQAGLAIGLAAKALAAAVLVHGLDLPQTVGHLGAWFGFLLGPTYGLALMGCLLVLAPGGHLPSRRWTWVPALLAGGYALVVAGLAVLAPWEFDPSAEAVGARHRWARVLVMTGQLGITCGLVGSAAALSMRLRRSSGEERQQLRWIGAAAVLLAATICVMVIHELLGGAGTPVSAYISAAFYLAYLAVPVATGLAVLRYRLYDIDVIIASTLRLGALALFTTTAYVLVVIAIGQAVGSRTGTHQVWSSLFAYVTVALGFQPVRRQVDAVAERLVHGARAAPYDSLAQLTRQLVAAPSEAELPGLIARSSASALGARSSHVTIDMPPDRPVTFTWPAASRAVPAARRGESVMRVPLMHDQSVLGELTLILPVGRAPTRRERRLLDELARQAGTALHNAALASRLRARERSLSQLAVELEASRRRVVTAVEAERAEVAMLIRRDVVVHLTGLPPSLSALSEQVRGDPLGVEHALLQMKQSIGTAIEALRGITGGLLPPALARGGLAAAVGAYAARQSPPHRVQVHLPVGQRFPPSVEMTSYMFIVSASSELAPAALITIQAQGDRLQLVVQGRRSSPPGRHGAEDRIRSVGGDVERDESDGCVTWRAAIPLTTPSAHADISESAPPARDVVPRATAATRPSPPTGGPGGIG